MANQTDPSILAPTDPGAPLKKGTAANPAAGSLAQIPAANDDATPVASPMPQASGAFNAGVTLRNNVINPAAQSLGNVTGSGLRLAKAVGGAVNDAANSYIGGFANFGKGVLGLSPAQPDVGGTASTAQPTPAANAIQQPITGQKSDDAFGKVIPDMGGTLYPELDQQPEQPAQSKATQQAGISGNVPKFDPSTLPQLSLPDPRQSMSRLPTAVSGINPYSLESGMDVSGMTPSLFNALPALMMAKAGLAPYQNAVSQAKQARGEAVQNNKQGMELYNAIGNHNMAIVKNQQENVQNAWGNDLGSFNAQLALGKLGLQQQALNNPMIMKLNTYDKATGFLNGQRTVAVAKKTGKTLGETDSTEDLGASPQEQD